MDYRIQEVLNIMKELEESARDMHLATLDADAVERGLSLSAGVCKQQEFVFPTPWMRNLMAVCGDIVPVEDDDTKEVKYTRLRTGQDSKAVDLINQWVATCLEKFNGPKLDTYDESLPVGSIRHLDCDCWLGWKPSIWDITPGQADQRAKIFLEYGEEATAYSYSQMVNAIKKEPHLQKAILLALEILPEVQASREVTAISDPFVSKGTGVSYPDYRNDRTSVDSSDVTYGRYEIELAQKAADNGLQSLLDFAYENNVYTAYPRNQRGKGRALEAQSRRTNLVVNMVNSPEMEEWKLSPVLNCPFLDEEGIKRSLVEMAEWVESHPDYVARNEDTSGWDRSVGSGWITLSGAVRYLRANGSFTKELVKMRHNCAKRSWLIDGPNDSVYEIFGRTPSGYDDTTLLNSSIHWILGNAAVMSYDPTYSQAVVYPCRKRNMKIVGDDICFITRKGEKAKESFRSYYKSKGYTIHSDEKSIFGVMFIQYRVFRDPETNEWLMSYNWPRVYRSMLSKEEAKQLGPCGWVLSAYQQLGKCVQYPKYCKIPLNLIAACDKYHLMLDRPINEIKDGVKQEDEDRLAGLSGEKRKKVERRSLTTAERLSNNPTIPGTREINGKVEIDWDYFGDIQRRLREMYDPNFLPSLGFKNPDLSVIR